MKEPKQKEIVATSLDDIGAMNIQVPIKRPDGKRVFVTMRALSEDEVWQIRREMEWPEPPTKDLQKIDGEILPVRDYADPDYQLAVDEANREFNARLLIASMQLAIPGETMADKVRALKTKVGKYAYPILLRTLNQINQVSDKELAAVAASFRFVEEAGAPGDEGAGDDAGAVAGNTEG